MIVRKPRRKSTKQGPNAAHPTTEGALQIGVGQNRRGRVQRGEIDEAGLVNVGNGEVSIGSRFQALAEEDQDDHHDPFEEIQAMESTHAPLGVEGTGR